MALLLCACASEPSREGELRSVLTRADDLLLRTRPQLVAGKYARMATAPFEYYRGNLAVFRHDWERGAHTGFPVTLTPVHGLGDPHPENFGILVAPDGTAALEPNDFDTADTVPALFDVRRLTIGMALAARSAGLDDAAAERIAAATAASWANGLLTSALGRIDAAGSEPLLEDLFRRSARDVGTELDALTRPEIEGRRFLRGAPDPEEPTQVLQDLPPNVLAELEKTFTFVDAVREQGSGVSSWPRIRVLMLGADGAVTELKELTESTLAGWYTPVLPARETAERVLHAAQTSWARPDADGRFRTTVWSGLPVLLRTESEANKNVRLSRLTGSRGSEAAVTGLGTTLGALLARVHAEAAAAPDDVAAFAVEEGAVALAGASQVVDDHARLVALLSEHGPLLGFAAAPGDFVPADFASLIGVPR